MSDLSFYHTPEEIETKKREFAAALMRNPLSPDKAVREVESRLPHISHILQNWQYDADVNQYMRELRDIEGVSASIPTKEQFAAKLYMEANECRTKDMALDYYKLFAEVMGFVDKGRGTTINNNSVLNQRNVLVMPQMRQANEIEGELVEQQKQLINGH